MATLNFTTPFTAVHRPRLKLPRGNRRNVKFLHLLLLLFGVILLNLTLFHRMYPTRWESKKQMAPHLQAKDSYVQSRRYMKKPGRYYTGSIKKGGEAEEGSSGRKKKYLVMWPTIPAAEGGSSDTRVVDVIRELVELDYEVDFIFWKDLEGSMGKAALFDLGVNRILGPYENSKISRHPPSDLNGYTTIFLWSWTNSKFMNWILDTVR